MLSRREFLKALTAATGGVLLPGASEGLLRGLHDVNHLILRGYLKTFGIPVAKVPKGKNGLFFNGQFKAEDHIGDYGPGVDEDVERFVLQRVALRMLRHGSAGPVPADVRS